MKKTLTKGFTLIELLVVIAIIGILASVILASLNSARNKGADAAIKSDLENARTQAEIYYDTAGNTYKGLCGTGIDSIGAMVVDAASKSGHSYTPPAGINPNPTQSAAVPAICHENATAWVISVPLQTPLTPAAYWCVESTGKVEQTTNRIGAGIFVCP